MNTVYELPAAARWAMVSRRVRCLDLKPGGQEHVLRRALAGLPFG